MGIFINIRKRKITLTCICFLLIILTIGLAVGLTRSSSASGTTKVSVGLNNIGILNINQGRMSGGCGSIFDNIDATVFENQVKYIFNQNNYLI